MAEFDDRAFREFCKQVLSKLAIFETACSSVSRIEAGGKLGMDGSQVGKTIKDLETDLARYLMKGHLIDHSGPLSIHPTAAGKRLVEFAKQVHTISSAFLNDLEMMQRNADIRLVMTKSAWIAYRKELEIAYKSECPEGSLKFGDEFRSKDQVWDEIEQMVLSGHADAAIYTYPPSREKKKNIPMGLAIQRWIDEEIVLVFPAANPHAPTTSVVSLRHLPHLERIVHYRRSLGFDRTTTIESYLRQQRVLRRFGGDWLIGVDTIDAIKDTLVQVGGMSFLPWPDVKHEHNEGKLKVYKLDPPMRPRVVRIAYRLDASRPALMKFRAATAKLQGKREFIPLPPAEDFALKRAPKGQKLRIGH